MAEAENQPESGTVAKNVTIPTVMDKFVRGLVADGFYSNYSEVVRASIRLLHSNTQMQEAQLTSIRQAISEGRRDIANGDHHPFDANRIKEEI